jgi:uncharacterized protein involved in exopolysaccharide biosynthesis
MNELIGVGVLIAACVAGMLAFAPAISESLVRSRARRLPRMLSARMGEEWLAELDALPGRPSQLAFAIALTLTRRRSFAIDEESLFAATARSAMNVATFGGWRSVVALTTILTAGVAYAASFLIRPLYESTNRVLVVPSRVSAHFVESMVRMTLDERLRAISQIVLSRSKLEDIIREFNLYGADRGFPLSGNPDRSVGSDLAASNKPRIADRLIERMRNDIRVELRADDAFEIRYVSPEPKTAMKVADRLASLFIEASLRDREVVTDSASQFLLAQIEAVRSRLLKPVGATSPAPTDPAEADVQRFEHELLKATYRDLLMKKEQARISANLERRQIGEQFKLLDPARLPEVPISPNRTRLTLLGAVVGFCLGVVMMLAGRNGPLRRPKKVLAQS